MAKRITQTAEHLKCRSWYHAWDLVVTYVSRIGNDTVYDAHLRCMRCGGERFDTTVRGHGLVSRRYKMPDGYHVKGLKETWGTNGQYVAAARDALYKYVAVPAPDEVKARTRKRLAQ